MNKDTLKQARFEILDLRRRNEVLSAKVEMIDLFACVLHTKAAEKIERASPDVAWELQKAIEEIEREEANRPRT